LHALSRGTTRDHVAALEVVLADGSVASVDGDSNDRDDAHAVLVRNINENVRKNATAIENGYPSLRGIINNGGYALDVLLRRQTSGDACSLVPLICGAEGTLAIVTRATLKLVEPPTVRRLCCLHFDSIDAALRAVAGLRATLPAALELMDRAILRMAASHPQHNASRFWLQGDPAAVLLVEYAGDSSSEVDDHIRDLQRMVDRDAMTVVAAQHIERAWALRRGALSMLMQAEGGLRAVTGIEDAAVAVADLPGFFAEVSELLQRQSLPFFVYGPVGMGSLHIRPELDLRAPGALMEYERLLDAVAAITVRFRGSFTCKHGDGRMRGKYLGAMLGDDMVQAMREVKRAFDPLGILNPGKILDCPPLTADFAPYPV
jgi:FAD/FMN-containing dehydrogenase